MHGEHAPEPSTDHRAVDRRVARRTGRVALVLGAILLASCGSSTIDGTQSASRTSPTTASTAGDFTGLVDVGDGRRMFATCRGIGSPTVVLIAGKGNGAADWQQVLDRNDTAHGASGDDVSAGMGKIEVSDEAVFPKVARFTRVCAYDRPDVRIDGEVTTPRTQPHTVDLDVNDLHALLTAMGEPGPYVLVAHSYGGFIANLFARAYPTSVGGLVMVDAGSELMQDVVTPEKFASWDASNAMTSPEVREGVQVSDATKKINAAPPMPKVPAVVLSADKPWRADLLPPDVDQNEIVSFDDWEAQGDRLAAALDAVHITKTNSGHAIYLYSPQLVIDAIHSVVDDVRGRNTTTTR